MPKDRRVQSLSFDRSRASPYPCSSSSRGNKQYKNGLPSGSLEDTKEWEEVRCPICLEHPHNTVLLQCSSYEKGCRPYMCDTSYRHSNCLDQFFKTSELTPSNETEQENPPRSVNPSITREEASLPGQSRHDMRLLQPNLSCPLCRGEIYGYMVVEAARKFMNSKVRSCSCENCDFSGTYSALRQHARSEHPSIRPTEVDPARQHHWQWLERIRGFRDFLSFMQPMIGEHNSEIGVSSDDPSNFVLFLLGTYLIHEVEEFLGRGTEQLHGNQSSPGSLRFRHNMETNHAPRSRWSNNLRSGWTHDGRYNMETNRDPRRDPRWNYNLREERANHGRYNVETNRYPRWNDNQHPWRTNNSQGLLWRGQRRRTFNNQR
ncbi:hypothetical protein ACOSQ3_021091 [Xanthoceras sorbifolium]